MITSPENPKIKLIKKLLSKSSFRNQENMFVLEGKRFVLDALKNDLQNLVFLGICSEEKSLKLPKNIEQDKIYYLDTNVLKKISPLRTPPGVLAVIKKPFWDLEQILKKAKNIVLVDRLQDPSNLGAVIRNCVAFKMDAVLYTPGTVDPFHPESLRAMAGNYYQLPVLEIQSSDLIKLIDKQTSVFSLTPNAETPLSKISLSNKNVFIFGSERQGIVTPELLALESKSTKIKINISKDINSLNVAVSSGIVLYEISRTLF
ncbi:TrmH family RNA methyltransferase [Candidatus Margulisiibacteriota bacterium]